MKYLIYLIELFVVLNLTSSQEEYKHNTQTQDSLAELKKAAEQAESLDKLLNADNEATAIMEQLMKAEIQNEDSNEHDLEGLLDKQVENQQNEEPQPGEEEKAMSAQDPAKAQYSWRYYYRRMRMYKGYYLRYRKYYNQQKQLHMKYRRLYSTYYRSNHWCLQQLSHRG